MYKLDSSGSEHDMKQVSVMYKFDSSGREDGVKQVSVCTCLIAVVGRMT